jgi:glucose-1-phosphate thymidylyltransferase
MGTPDALADATNYVMALEKRTGVKVGCPEESAWRANLIDDDKLKDSASLFAGSPYGDYLSGLF